ncbi:uncharacterized protein LOC120460672 [Pimephales promelas]|uniref:uncharacterized protein LOC120460672 n=1 Tax=Pimephales promelas TaxID=90988 RepID=UPI001955494D|nr:uncharacterized protein LOC120460672 [Pimephales promelas]XP_039504517.1 uncharacterized protein LOC120460672 [Pimephales promelas]KAG1956367.1 hypothetical protein F2P79_008120 [Pimephales promelas]
MWFLVLSCVVVAARPDPMGTLNPNEPEQQAQNPSNGSPFGQDPAFPGQNGGGRGYESELTRSGSGLTKGTQRSGQWHRWGGTGKPLMNGRDGRPSYKPTQAPVGGGRENQMNPLFGRSLSPNMMDNRQFIPIFKADNVTVQNVSAFHLKEGENVFLLPKGRGQMQPPKKDGVRRPQELGFGHGFSSYGPQPYVKLIYNPTATQRISFEYGITQLLPAFMKAESESDHGTK